MARVAVKLGVQPKIVAMVALLANVATEITEVEEIVITSAMDSSHGVNSLHFALRALDVRTKSFPTMAAKAHFVTRVREEFGPEYDVILEDVGTDNEHLHIEWDPR